MKANFASSAQSTKILLARSPAHIHLITVEFRRHSPTTLTRAIKQVFSGTLEKLLLYAVENGKNSKDAPGVCESEPVGEEGRGLTLSVSQGAMLNCSRNRWREPELATRLSLGGEL